MTWHTDNSLTSTRTSLGLWTGAVDERFQSGGAFPRLQIKEQKRRKENWSWIFILTRTGCVVHDNIGWSHVWFCGVGGQEGRLLLQNKHLNLAKFGKDTFEICTSSKDLELQPWSRKNMNSSNKQSVLPQTLQDGEELHLSVTLTQSIRSNEANVLEWVSRYTRVCSQTLKVLQFQPPLTPTEPSWESHAVPISSIQWLLCLSVFLFSRGGRAGNISLWGHSDGHSHGLLSGRYYPHTHRNSSGSGSTINPSFNHDRDKAFWLVSCISGWLGFSSPLSLVLHAAGWWEPLPEGSTGLQLVWEVQRPAIRVRAGLHQEDVRL